MMRRLSKLIRHNNDSNGVENENKDSSTNGESSRSATNGYTNGTSGETTTPVKQKRKSLPFRSSTSKVMNSSKYPEPPDHSESRVDLEASLGSLLSLVDHSMRALPTEYADGTYAKEENHPSRWKELSTIGLKDVKTLKDQLVNGKGPVDDKTMLMERVIQLVADLPDKSPLRKDLTNTFVDTLFNTLPHPPLSYLGDRYRYRQADGSYNNIMYPHIGQANMPYARTVQAEAIQPASLPDPGLVFDSLFGRNEFRRHPNNNSSIIFYWASIIIHDLFQTDHDDFSKSQTSSYLDLSPLYGDVQEDQDQIRTFKDGLLKPDSFCEHRLLSFPPGVGVILIMFNRFHNHVAQQLAAINENGRFNKPSPDLPEEKAKKAWAKYDHELFNTARLVTSGLYMNITLTDYVRQIVNLNRSNTTWTLDPRVKMSDTCFNDNHTQRGTGNQVSAEFALVYRWHSSISERDDKWTQQLFKDLFGKPAEEVGMPELLAGLAKMQAEIPDDPMKRPFAGLKRGEDGKYSDDELVNIISDSIEDVAGAFGPNHIPRAMKAIEILGMKQARAWEVGSLNEFRRFFGLKEHQTFEDIHPDKDVAEQLRNLYETPDQVELYTGLIAEKDKQPMSEDEGGPVGVGISPTYTISRAILSDAVALVRGDRFYTIDYTPKNLTNWGYSEVATNFDVEQGCCFSKLFLRAFPHHFKPNSIYAHHPMTIPSENQKIMRNLGRESHYSYDRPKRTPGRVMIQNYRGVRQVLENAQVFNSAWGPGIEYVFTKRGGDFMLAGDTQVHSKQKETMKGCLYHDEWHSHIRAFYEDITEKLIKEKTVNIAGNHQIDMTRDVANLSHIHFAAAIFSLPLKTAENPRGVFSEQELYLTLVIMFACVFFDVDPVKSFELALGARTVAQKLGKLVEANVHFTSTTGTFSHFVDKMRETEGPMNDYGVKMIRRILDSGMSVEDATWSQILPTATAMVGNQAQVFTQILDFYLTNPIGIKHWPDVVATAKSAISKSPAPGTKSNDPSKDPAGDEKKLLHYCMEAVRLHGTFGAYRDVTEAATIDDSGFTGVTDPSQKGKDTGTGTGKVHVKSGDSVFVSFVQAHRDPEIFPDPMEVKLDRPLDSYLAYGQGPHQCLGMRASQTALTAMLKVVAGKLDNLRPAPGPQGQLKKVDRGDGFYAFMDKSWAKFFPFPLTWKLFFDKIDESGSSKGKQVNGVS